MLNQSMVDQILKSGQHNRAKVLLARAFALLSSDNPDRGEVDGLKKDISLFLHLKPNSPNAQR